jgi:uncharacterized protein DUF3999
MTPIDAGAAWSAWTTVTPVVIAPAGRERYVRVPIPFAIAPDIAGGYPDLRVVDGARSEMPYAIDPQRAAQPPRRVAAIDTGFVRGRWTQAVFDLGASGALVDALTLDVDEARRPTYLVQVAVDASDDRVTWRASSDGDVIYRVAQDGGRGSRRVTFPPTRSRWLRVRIHDPHAAFPIAGASLEPDQSDGVDLARVPLRPVRSEDAAQHRTVFAFDAPVAFRAAAVTFADGRGTFARHAIVEASDDGTSWDQAGDATIARYPEGGRAQSFALNERTARHWRVIVEDGNDRPVTQLRAALWTRRHDVVFAAEANASYRILSGNAGASAPAYDLGQRLAHGTWTAVAGTTALSAPNGSFRDGRTFADRMPPWLLSVALAVVAALLGFVALRTVRTAQAR